MKQKLYLIIAILCALAGTTHATDKTVTYAFTAENTSSSRWTLTFTPNNSGFGYSTGAKTVTIPDVASTTGFNVTLDDGLQFIYSRSAGHMTFIGFTSFGLNWSGDENTYLTLHSSRYYVTHVKLVTADGVALVGRPHSGLLPAPRWTPTWTW